MKTTILDLLGVACLALFGFAIWPPAALLVVGVAALLMSWTASRSAGPGRPQVGGDS